ncbi:MAG: hypothetical protein JXR83_17240 [Deltaproteobacteria bacterium]|nr:hypothetical protein [Deltaproteobacteria bacterium]
MRQPVARVSSAQAAWFLRLVLYLALVVSALVTLFGLPEIQRRVDANTLAPLWLLAPAFFFGLFLLVYAVDRYRLVHFRSYPSGRALFQVFLGVVFLMLLLPSSIVEYRSALTSRPSRDELSTLMRHRDARVRALACEVAGTRREGTSYLQALGNALADRNGKVSAAARQALRRITGRNFSVGQQGRRELESFLRDHPLDLDAAAGGTESPPSVIPTNASPPPSAASHPAADERGRDAASAG